MSEGWGAGSTRRWRRIRAEVLARNALENRGLCQLAYPGEWTVLIRTPGQPPRTETRRCEGVANVVHHVVGKVVSGDDPRYLQAVCRPCNLHAGDPLAQPDPPVVGVTRW